MLYHKPYLEREITYQTTSFSTQFHLAGGKRSSFKLVNVMTNVLIVLAGFMSAIAVHPDKIRSMKVPNSVRGLCPTDPKALDETEIP